MASFRSDLAQSSGHRLPQGIAESARWLSGATSKECSGGNRHSRPWRLRVALGIACTVATWGPSPTQAQQISRAYLLSVFEVAPTSPPLVLTGLRGVQLTLNAQGVAVGAQDIVTPVSIGMDLTLPYRMVSGGLWSGRRKKPKLLSERVDHALVSYDDIGLKIQDKVLTVAFRKGTKLVLDLGKPVGALLVGGDGALDPFRLEYSATQDFAAPTLLFDGLDVATKNAIRARPDFTIDDFLHRKGKLDQAYLFFVNSPPGFLRVSDTHSYGDKPLKLDCVLGHAVACGDQLLDPSETCDPPGDTCDPGSPCNPCRADCTRCGDGVVQAQDSEACDPPCNPAVDPQCGSFCATNCSLCGNRNVERERGETCDPPELNCDPDGPCVVICRDDCTRCGDNEVQRQHGETCDPPGSYQPPSNNMCRGETCTYCGDGVTQTALGEQCDPPCDPNHTPGCGTFCGPSCQL